MMALSESDFDKKGIDDAIAVFKQVSLAPVQRKVIDSFSLIIHKYININELALKGFALRGIRKWQINNKMKVSELMTMTPQQRIEAIKEMIVYVEEMLFKILKDPSKQKAVRQGLEQFLEEYSTTFAQR